MSNRSIRIDGTDGIAFPANDAQEFLCRRVAPRRVPGLAILLAALTVVAGTAHAVDANCPLPGTRMVPADAEGVDGAWAIDVPLVPNPSSLPRDVDGLRGVRFQQVIAPPIQPGLHSLTALNFRLDAGTPLASFHGDLTYVVEVRLGVLPDPTAQLTPFFSQNLAQSVAPVAKVFDGAVIVAGTGELNPPPAVVAAILAAPAEEITIGFEVPYEWQSMQGSLLIDVSVRGISGDNGAGGENLAFFLDAVEAGDESRAIASRDGAGAEVGQLLPAVPVVRLTGVDGPILVNLAQQCLASLPLQPADAAALMSDLEAAHAAAARFQPTTVVAELTEYRERVDALLAAGQIDPSTADQLHGLGREEALALESLPPFLRGVENTSFSLAGFPAYMFIGNFYQLLAEWQPSPRFNSRNTAPVDAAFHQILADFEIQATEQQDFEEAKKKLCDLIDEMKRDKKNDPKLIKVMEDLKTVTTDLDLLKKAFEALGEIIKDQDLDKADLPALKALKEALQAMIDKLSDDSIVGCALKQFKELICQLTSYLESGKLVSITVTEVGGKLFIRFDVEGEIELRLLCIEVDTQSDYGKTRIYIDLHIKKDATVSFCPDPKNPGEMKVEFRPPDAIDLDLDSSGIWVVHVIESLTGIPDLDKFCFDSIEIKDGKVVIKGTSDGKAVVITISGGSVTITVDGEPVFPKKK